MRPGYVNDIFEWPGKCARQTQAMKLKFNFIYAFKSTTTAEKNTHN